MISGSRNMKDSIEGIHQCTKPAVYTISKSCLTSEAHSIAELAYGFWDVSRTVLSEVQHLTGAINFPGGLDY